MVQEPVILIQIIASRDNDLMRLNLAEPFFDRLQYLVVADLRWLPFGKIQYVIRLITQHALGLQKIRPFRRKGHPFGLTTVVVFASVHCTDKYRAARPHPRLNQATT